MRRALRSYWDGRVIGCPGTIDNDLAGTDVSIGFTSAVSTAAEAIDKIRDTADATERLFLVEVMGRHSGQIAIYTALATGADAALIPEVPLQIDEVMERLQAGAARAARPRGSSSSPRESSPAVCTASLRSSKSEA